MSLGVSRHIGISFLLCLTIDGWFVSADIEDHVAAEAGWKWRENLVLSLCESSGGSGTLLQDWGKSISSDLLDPHHIDNRG
jgi:hypothetical protein